MTARNLCVFGPALAVAAEAQASIVAYIDEKPLWDAAVGQSWKADFASPTGSPSVVSQDFYASLGITLASKFVPGGCNWGLSQNVAASDGWIGKPVAGFYEDQPSIVFGTHQRAFAFDRWAPNGFAIAYAEFYLDGVLQGSIYSSPGLGHNFNGIHFFGWTTDFDFNRVMVAADYFDSIYVVDIPGPGTLALVTLGFAMAGRRRR